VSDRNPRGRFSAGNRAGRGRIAGSENKTTTDFRKIKEQLAGSYDRVDGDAIFDRLAREQPAVWCSLIVKCLPKEADLHVDQVDPLNMYAPGQEPDAVKDEFYCQLVELAGDGPITSDVCRFRQTTLAQLLVSQPRLHVLWNAASHSMDNGRVFYRPVNLLSKKNIHPVNFVGE